VKPIYKASGLGVRGAPDEILDRQPSLMDKKRASALRTATHRSRDNESQTMPASPSTAMVANEILIIDPGTREIGEIFQI
jgi:hypothetical protein